MKLRTLVAGLLLLLAGLVLVAGWFPGAPTSAGSWRKAMGATLLTLGGLTVLIPATVAFLRYTTRGEDYVGGCPVGSACPQGHFVYKPRKVCPQCGAAVAA